MKSTPKIIVLNLNTFAILSKLQLFKFQWTYIIISLKEIII